MTGLPAIAFGGPTDDDRRRRLSLVPAIAPQIGSEPPVMPPAVAPSAPPAIEPAMSEVGGMPAAARADVGLDLPAIVARGKEFQRAQGYAPTTDVPAIDASTTGPATSTSIPDPIETELASRTAELNQKSQYHDKHWSKWDKVAAAVEGWAKGGIFGAISAVKDPHYFEDQRIARDREQLLPVIGTLSQIRDANLNVAGKRAQIENVMADNKRLDQQAKDTTEWRKSETARKTDDRVSRESTSRMTAVAGMLKNLPEFIPGDPRYAEMEQALGDVNLPVTRKDAKKKVDLKQDQRTGAWTVILTNPLDGKQETRDVLKDGKPFASTPTVVMQGEYGLLKQDDAQAHDTEEKAKDRGQRQQQFLMSFQQHVSDQLKQFAGDAQKTARWKSEKILQIQKDRLAGKLDAETADGMLAAIGQ
jgi:hypothetical protein